MLPSQRLLLRVAAARHDRYISTQPPPPPLDTRAALATLPTRDVLRGWAVLTACRVPWLAAHAGSLLKVALKVPPLRYVIRHTFAAQFTAGESDDDVARTAASLAASGIGAIYDYAAEPDDSEGGGVGDASTTVVAPEAAAAAAAGAAPPAAAVARTHGGGEPGADAAGPPSSRRPSRQRHAPRTGEGLRRSR